MNLYQEDNSHQRTVSCYILGEYHTGLTIRGLMEIRLNQARQSMSLRSYSRLKCVIDNHINPVLGDYEIDYLTQADLDSFLQEKRENGRLDGNGGLSESTVHQIEQALSTAFKMVRWDVKDDSVFIDAPHLKPIDEILTMDQADILTRYLTQNIDRCNAGYLLCLFTGIKMSEVCSLKDSDIDLKNDRIHIQRTMRRAVNGTMRSSTFALTDYPDDYYGNRFLKLPVKLSVLLWTLLRQSKEDVFFLSGRSDSSIPPRTFQDRFKKMLPDVGLPDELNFHMLRNTFAWMWLLRGDDLDELTYVMGYKNTQVTLLTYGPLMEHLNVRLPGCVKYLSLSGKGISFGTEEK